MKGQRLPKQILPYKLRGNIGKQQTDDLNSESQQRKFL